MEFRRAESRKVGQKVIARRCHAGLNPALIRHHVRELVRFRDRNVLHCGHDTVDIIQRLKVLLDQQALAHAFSFRASLQTAMLSPPDTMPREAQPDSKKIHQATVESEPACLEVASQGLRLTSLR